MFVLSREIVSGMPRLLESKTHLSRLVYRRDKQADEKENYRGPYQWFRLGPRYPQGPANTRNFSDKSQKFSKCSTKEISAKSQKISRQTFHEGNFRKRKILLKMFHEGNFYKIAHAHHRSRAPLTCTPSEPSPPPSILPEVSYRPSSHSTF